MKSSRGAFRDPSRIRQLVDSDFLRKAHYCTASQSPSAEVASHRSILGSSVQRTLSSLDAATCSIVATGTAGDPFVGRNRPGVLSELSSAGTSVQGLMVVQRRCLGRAGSDSFVDLLQNAWPGPWA